MASRKEEAQATAEANQAAERGELIQVTPTFTPVNTTTSIPGTKIDQQGNKISEKEIKDELARTAKILGSSKKKTISIPKQLVSTLGDTIPACINGVCIRVPVDGEEYEVAEEYVAVIRESLKTINSGDVRATLQAGANEDFLEVKNTRK